MDKFRNQWNHSLWNKDVNLANTYYCLVAQPCPTLCDPVNCNPEGSSVHGFSQARILACISSPGDLPNPGIEPRSPTLTGGFFTAEPAGKPNTYWA